MLENAIYWINLHPMDGIACFAITYPLDSNLSAVIHNIICPLYNWALINFISVHEHTNESIFADLEPP